MRKKMQTKIGKALLFVLTTICIIVFGISSLSFIVFGEMSQEWDTRDHMKNEIYENMASNYVFALLDNNRQSEEDWAALDGGNLWYAVYKNGKLLYQNSTEVNNQSYAYQFTYNEGEWVSYSTNSLLRCMVNHGHSGGESGKKTYTLAIEKLIYAKDTGLFYWQTEKGYYPVQEFYDSEWNSYKLNKAGNAYVCDEMKTRYTYGEENLYFADVPFSYGKGSGDYYQFEEVESTAEMTAGEIMTPSKNYWLLTNDSIGYHKEGSEKSKDQYVVYATVGFVPLKTSATMNIGLTDYFAQATELINWYFGWKQVAGFLQAISLILGLAGFVLLMCVSGRKATDDEVHNHAVDRMPFVIVSAVVVTLISLAVVGAVELIFEASSLDFGILVLLEVELVVAAVALGLWYCMSIAVRIKTHTFWRYTLLHYILAPFRKLWRNLRDSLHATKAYHSLRWRIWLAFGLLFLAEVVFLSAVGAEGESIGVLMVLKVIEIPLILMLLAQLVRIKEGGERIASGDYSTAIDTTRMLQILRSHAENINSVGDGIARAVEDRMKSERFKTELITNVSHDIKTPLTSIINYVDLIKKENVQDETLREYVDVLDRQSARLKKLIEDLMEASKASTGNLKVNLEKCDASVLLGQIVGEYEEKMAKCDLNLIVQKPQEPVWIMADGRHLFRVYDNLMNNIVKYAQSGTRVYVNLEKRGERAVVTFRNTSKYQLNISAEELLERFSRGDSSRNTEGNGLGLNIAQSLTELMNGNMTLQVDGDLFKVELDFPMIREL